VAIVDGVAAILAHQTQSRDLPADAGARLTEYRRRRRVLTALMDDELVTVLDALASDGIRPLVIKGAHLAHTLYPSPELRPRADTDLLVTEDDRDRVSAALARVGYERLPHVRGTVILGQCHYTKADRVGVVHALDVHWRVAAPLVFANVLPFEALRPAAVSIPALGSNAFGPSRAHALVLACIHLAAHHRRHPILVWLFDVRLLAESLEPPEQAAFVDTAGVCGVTRICAKVLEDATHYFDHPALATLAGRVGVRGAGQSEPSARLLTATRRVDELLLDLKTPASWRTRMTLVREHLWPDADYMRASGARGWLPLAYAGRIVRGARKWLQRGPEGREG
jgi:hypothetical protein